MKTTRHTNTKSVTKVRASYQSPLGPMTLVATAQGLAGIWFDGQKHMPDISNWQLQEDFPVLLQTKQQLGEYFAGKRQQFDLPLDIQGGTAFQQQVWRALLEIPAAETDAYGALAKRIGNSAAVRAVGGAVGRNPISIVIPCHRVLGADGSLTGFAGGIERKIALLKLEQDTAASNNTLPEWTLRA